MKIENKHIYCGLGLVALAGLGIYLYNKYKKEDVVEKPSTTPEKTAGAEGLTPPYSPTYIKPKNSTDEKPRRIRFKIAYGVPQQIGGLRP